MTAADTALENVEARRERLLWVLSSATFLIFFQAYRRLQLAAPPFHSLGKCVRRRRFGVNSQRDCLGSCVKTPDAQATFSNDTSHSWKEVTYDSSSALAFSVRL